MSLVWAKARIQIAEASTEEVRNDFGGVVAMESNILLVEPNDILRNGLSCSLAQSRRIRRITEATDPARALAAAERERFSVAILGRGLADDARHDLLDRLVRACAHTRCIVIVRGESHGEVARAIVSRAAGILCGESSAQELWAAIESADRGTQYVCRTLQQGLLASLRLGPNPRIGSFCSLTNRERTILSRIGLGESNREIAAELGLSRRTVDTHRTHLMRKLGIHNTAGLVRLAVRERLIEA
jgi:two-component system invasion response regulator UvrY